jgi:hypothetical protein
MRAMSLDSEISQEDDNEITEMKKKIDFFQELH